MSIGKRKLTVELTVEFESNDKVRGKVDSVPKRLADVVAGDIIHVGGKPAVVIRVDDLPDAPSIRPSSPAMDLS
jgi:hypothetical protein